MQNPLFNVDEECLLYSIDFPQFNGTEVTVLQIEYKVAPYNFGDERELPSGWFYRLSPNVADIDGFWAESALRKKHKPSDFNLTELMEELNNIKVYDEIDS